MTFEEIGAVLRAARDAAGLSQTQIARPLGMSRATVSGIENGTIKELGIRKLMALCASVGLELHAGPKRQRPTLQELREERRAAQRRA